MCRASEADRLRFGLSAQRHQNGLERRESRRTRRSFSKSAGRVRRAGGSFDQMGQVGELFPAEQTRGDLLMVLSPVHEP